MKLEIKNIRNTFFPEEKYIDVVSGIIKRKLTDYKISAGVNIANDTIVISSSDLKLFSSSVENRVPLKPTDARWSKDKPYLTSRRLTKKQWEGLTEVFINTLSHLDVLADIEVYDVEGTKIDIKEGFPKPKSFTVESEVV